MMPLDYQTTVSLNLALQLILAATLCAAVFLAKKKRFQRHCLVLRLAVAAQIFAILALMSPVMGTIVEPGRPNGLFQAEVLLHHGLGLVVVLLWIYINLVYLGRLKARLAPKLAMQAAAGLWVVSFILGFHIYLKLYY
jgi:putative membrane protein